MQPEAERSAPASASGAAAPASPGSASPPAARRCARTSSRFSPRWYSWSGLRLGRGDQLHPVVVQRIDQHDEPPRLVVILRRQAGDAVQHQRVEMRRERQVVAGAERLCRTGRRSRSGRRRRRPRHHSVRPITVSVTGAAPRRRSSAANASSSAASARASAGTCQVRQAAQPLAPEIARRRPSPARPAAA